MRMIPIFFWWNNPFPIEVDFENPAIPTNPTEPFFSLFGGWPHTSPGANMRHNLKTGSIDDSPDNIFVRHSKKKIGRDLHLMRATPWPGIPVVDVCALPGLLKFVV